MNKKQDNLISTANVSLEKSFWSRFLTLLGLIKVPDTKEELEQEIHELLEEGEEHGLISGLEERMISSIFDFRETVASEIMTPSAEMICAEEGTTPDKLSELITREGYTRIPIFRGDKDHIIGILHAKDLLCFYAGSSDTPPKVEDFFNSPTFISEAKPITELLREFQSKKTHLAMVNDEFGGVRGLVTLEDIIEEIVGDIDDEHDQEERELLIVDEATIIVDAKIDIEEVESHFKLELPEGPYESVGGLVIHQLGRVPQNGAIVKAGNLTFKVLAANRRKIKSVRIKYN